MMHRSFSFYSLVFFAALSLSVGALAQEAVKSKADIQKMAEENKKKVEAEIEKETPITEWASSEKALLKRLPEGNQKIFFIMRQKHSAIRAVEVVRRDVGNAVKACGKENKDMTKTMNKRFKQWKDSINPILKNADDLLKTELKEQEAFHVSDYKHVMALNDKAYDFSESKIKKTPVTTKEACQKLLDSMDRTEDSLISLLQSILLPEDVVRERAEQAQKIKDKAEKK